VTDQIAVVEFTTPASPGTLPITSPDITEAFSAAILIFTRETSDGTNNNHGVLGIGFIGVDGVQGEVSLQCAISCSLEHGLTAGQDNDTARSQAACVLATDGSSSGGLDIVAEYDSAVAGGFVLDFTTTDVQAKCTAIIFAGLSKAAAGACTFSDAGETHEEVGAAADQFEPDVVIFRSSDNVVNGATPNGTLALGFATNTDAIQQVSAYVNWDDRIDPTDSDGFLRSDCASGGFIGDRGVAMDRFQVTSFDATGFNGIAIDTGDGNSPQANYLALKFSTPVHLACANLAVSASTGAQDFTVGFPPRLVLGMSTLMTTLDTLIDGATASAAGYFVTGELGERAYTVHNREDLNLNPTTSDAHTRQEDVGVLTYEHTGSIAQRATWDQALTSGFRLNFSVATAGYLTALAIGFFEVDTETVEIADGAVLLAEDNDLTLVTSEVVEISESFDSEADTVASLANQTRLGRTTQAGAQRGSTLQAGPIMGRTVQ
jgi:hypothetical protein